MKPIRIVLALVAASLAAPALAEKCHICDFSDEPIVVKPTKAADPTPLAAPGGLAAAPDASQGRRTYEPILIQKRIDKSSPMLQQPLSRNDRPMESLSLNYGKIDKGAPALKAAAPVGPATRR